MPKRSRFNRTRTRRSGRSFLLTIFTLVIAGAIALGVIMFEGEKPTVTLKKQVRYLGANSNVALEISDKKSGIQTIRVSVRQNNTEHEFFNSTTPRKKYGPKAGPAKVEKSITLNTSKKDFKDGDAQLIIEVRDFSLRGLLKGNLTRLEEQVKIDTKPPTINILHSERYIKPGGAGIVIYSVSKDTARHGVRFNNNFYPGFPVADGRQNTNNAFIALPYDALKIEESKVVAVDQAGNMASRSFIPTMKKVRWKKDRINVGDGFLNRKIPEFEEFYPDMKGELVDKYLYVNETVRQQNNALIKKLCSKPQAERLWQGQFLRMPGSTRANYADHRTYYYKGKAIDKQVHLGVDLASTKRVEVKAANKGKVIHAGYHGIYGKMVILDHGQGVFSLYSHLSQMLVQPGDVIEKNVPLGLTGTTGMAGGDHLHFSMLVNGLFVTPKEWWDPHWIAVTIDQPLVDSKF
ncbi:MAG: M23 family metallopeptidase [Thermodesulfobacteriota bacterium]